MVNNYKDNVFNSQEKEDVLDYIYFYVPYEAKENMIRYALEDSAMLENTHQEAQKVTWKNVNNIGDAVGREYSIQWKYI